MCGSVTFPLVLDFFKSHGYELAGWYRGFAIFTRPNDENSVAFGIRVDKDKKTVCKGEFDRIKNFFS